MNRFIRLAAFLAGLAAVAWVGAGYIGGNPLALAMTALIGAAYVLGALELERFRQATAGLRAALDALEGPVPELAPWLERLQPALRTAVRRRIEGEPAALPGPALVPYLVGLLVLLGMLGTFLGMVLTLRGTGIALENATDLQAVRGSLVAPVKGLGLAFGTSVAGVATSAMLGLLSTLARRERVQVAQALDARIATALRPHSRAHQRATALTVLQRQADLLPGLVERVQAMMDAMERRAEAADARLLARQEAFQAQAAAAYAGLATAVDRSLKESLTESARLASATIGPAVEATLAGIARETAALQSGLDTATRRQLDELSARFEAAQAAAVAAWQSASGLAAADWRAATATAADGWQAASSAASAAWQAASDRHERSAERLSERLDAALGGFATTFDERSSALLEGVAHHEAAARTAMAETLSGLARETSALHARQQAAADARDAQRLAVMTQSLEGLAATLRAEWQQSGAQALARQQALCDTMAGTAYAITTQAEVQARATIAEIGRLVEAASAAPRAAAEVIGELRQKLSDSMARDNALLDERARVLQTLGTLLETVQQAAGAQREAIDALVGSSANLLDRVGERFGAQVEAQAGRLEAVAAQVTGSAVEVASLGEAFGAAVQQFADSNGTLVAHLERVDATLGQSLARSDEQLAYYVAQAREVIDLSILSQQRVLEDLQRLAGRALDDERAAA
jgi:hypothetical protein